MAAELTLGPLLYNWPAEQRRDFYFRIADEAPIDTVSVGEVVCTKRAPFFDPYLPEVVARLAAAGKAVVYATPILVMGPAETRRLRTLVKDPTLVVEANDVGAVGLLQGRPHRVGPFVNVYNADTLTTLCAQGAASVCLPVDLPQRSIAVLARVGAVEVSVFGRLPLSISARCYHARAHGLHKDGCRYVCEQDPDGLEMTTLDHEPLVAINGVQTVSHTAVNLVHDVVGLASMGVAAFRLWPQTVDMVAIARLFRDVTDGRMDPDDADAALHDLVPHLPFANGLHHGSEDDIR